MLFDEGLCKRGRNFTNKIWNAHRLVNSWDIKDTEPTESELVLINWFENKLKKSVIRLNKLFLEFRISDCLMLLYKLVWDDFCSCYLEIIKPYNKEISCVTIDRTNKFFEKILICLHPFMPFITEELFQNIVSSDHFQSISLSKWPVINQSEIDEKIITEFAHVLELISFIRKIRIDKKIPSSKSLKLLVDDKKILSFSVILSKTCNLEKIELFNDHEGELFPFLVGVHQYYIPSVLNVNISEEIENISQKINYFEGFLGVVYKKIKNKKFMNNAPKSVIDIELKKEKDTLDKIKSLRMQLNSLNERD